jgi:hydrogenase/urease accessory protein HupE
MNQIKKPAWPICMLCALAFVGSVQAHLLPAQNATMNLIDNAAYFVVSVPVSALQGVDENHDGLLSAAEIQAHNDAITRQFKARFQVTDGGKTGDTVLSWVVPPQTDGAPNAVADASSYIVIMQRTNFSSAIKSPVLTTDLFGTGSNEAQMTITATRGEISAVTNAPGTPATVREVAILQRGTTTHQFFRGARTIFFDFVRIGIEHILSGADHLLFLMTILLAAAGWRYWLGVITSFTIAHSITLSLSALNVLGFPARIIEPGIALSIVIMAGLNLWGMRTQRSEKNQSRSRHWTRVAIVFACGLLHGFGFASAIGAMAVDTHSRLATLAGFNVGIELGQCAFVGLALLLIALFRKCGFSTLSAQLPRFACIAAAIFGGVFFFQRLAFW